MLPFVLYSVFLGVIQFTREDWPASYPILYAAQCVLVFAALVSFRSKGLLPELTLGFHWSALVAGVGVAVLWIGMGWWMASEFAERWQGVLRGQPVGVIDYEARGVPTPTFAVAANDGPFDFRDPAMLGVQLGWVTLLLRLVGMSIVVPMFEELFVRSLLVRSLSHTRRTMIGMVQVAQDLPVIGDWLMGTRWGQKADRHPPIFGRVFNETPLGVMTLFGVVVSSLIFVSYHATRDKPACFLCGVIYCLVVWFTNRPASPIEKRHGLGPVIWAHGITNALLWAYTLATDDWQFL